MKQYKDFNKFNCAPYLADHIGVYNKCGHKVMNVKLNDFKPEYGERLYRFGLLSDVHNQKAAIIDDDADFRNALTFFNDKESVDFTCICGDITENGSSTQLNNYKTNVDTYSPNTPVYTCTGNHDCSGFNDETWENYTGNKRCFSFEYKGDVFIFFSMRYWSLGNTGTPYLIKDINWLERLLKENENKRVFIFTHLFFPD
jgi:predicted MPP superfamily phosphohydrolase